MSASARAEARRKAILSRGSDRLAKLTTSARGEDAPAYMPDASRSTSRTFLGEESSDMPVPKPISPSPSPSPQPRPKASPPHQFGPAGLSSNATPDPSVWSAEQQQQFMRALMGASLPGGQTPLQSPLGDPNAFDPNLPPMDNPLAAMLFPQGIPTDKAGMPGKLVSSEKPAPPTKLQQLMPLIHFVVMWLLLGYFVMWFEPNIFTEAGGIVGGSTRTRWAQLIRSSPLEAGIKAFKVQAVPFFWAFMTIEVVLHSLRIFSRSDTVQPPSLVALALPHLPQPFPSIIVNSLKYWQMAALFLDDLAGLIVGVGFIIYFAGL